MKLPACMYVWWPGLDKDIEKSVRQCGACQEVQSSPPAAPLHPWKWPSRPWARVHLDFAGPFQGKLFFVVIHAHSKWIEAVCTSSTSSQIVIEELRTVFSKFGLPETIVTDNGSSFTIQEFREFLKNNGIHHTTSAPYHSASNGMAERAVQIVKIEKVSYGSIKERLAKILFVYRNTPQSTTGLTPATMLLGRKPRTLLDLIKPHRADRVEQKQEKQKNLHDSHARLRVFQVGDRVYMYVKNYGSGNNWLSGSIVKCTGPVSFLVKLQDERERRCHQDQIRIRAATGGSALEESETGDASEVRENQSSEIFIDLPSANSSANSSAATECSSPTSEVSTATANQDSSPSTSSAQDSNLESSAEPPTRKSYPQRNRRPPQRLEPGHTN